MTWRRRACWTVGIYFYAMSAGDTFKVFYVVVRRAAMAKNVREATASPEIDLFVTNGRRKNNEPCNVDRTTDERPGGALYAVWDAGRYFYTGGRS